MLAAGPEYTTYLLPILLATVLLAPALSVWIARGKGRNWVEGLLLGLFLGWIGLVIEAALPQRQDARSE